MTGAHGVPGWAILLWWLLAIAGTSVITGLLRNRRKPVAKMNFEDAKGQGHENDQDVAILTFQEDGIQCEFPADFEEDNAPPHIKLAKALVEWVTTDEGDAVIEAFMKSQAKKQESW